MGIHSQEDRHSDLLCASSDYVKHLFIRTQLSAHPDPMTVQALSRVLSGRVKE